MDKPEKKIKGIILAAGRGSRMGNVTTAKPKCLVEINNQSLLTYQIQAMKEVGIHDIAIVTGYKREMLSNYKLKEFTNRNWRETNMVASLLCANEWLEESPCIISYSDIFYSTKAISLLYECQDDLSITYDPNWLELWSKRFSNPLDDAESFKINPETGVIIELGKAAKSTSEIDGQFMGLIRITPNSWEKLKSVIDTFSNDKSKTLDMTTLLQSVVENGDPVLYGIKFEGIWGEIDTVNDLRVLA